jgi:hypothetical protein
MAMITLGLSLNSRLFGLAVISGSELLDFHIQLRKESWSPHKKGLILASLQQWCNHYGITNIVLLCEQQTSHQTNDLVGSIKRFCNEQNIPLHSYSSHAFYSLYEGTRTKKQVMRKLVDTYPELIHQYRKEMNNKNKYYIKLFEAVGVATVHMRKMRKRK